MSVSWYTADDAEAQQRVVAAWKDAPLVNTEVLGMLLDIAKEQVIEYAPHGEPAAEVRTMLERLGYPAAQVTAALTALGVAPSVNTAPPLRFVWAQLQQAKHMWNAGRVAANGEVGADGFTFVPRPLDKDIQRIIRPVSGVANVL